MAIGVVAVGRNLLVVGTSHVVGDLVAEAVVAQGATFRSDGDGIFGADYIQVGHATAVKVLTEENSSVRGVPQSCHALLHGPEGI